jgi:integrase/recombinase XerD
MQNRNIYPILLTWKLDKRGTYPLYLAVDVNNKRTATKSLKRRIDPTMWDTELKKLRDNAPNAQLINALIKKEMEKIDADLLRKELLGMAMTKEAVRKVAKGLDTGADFYAYCRSRLVDEQGNDDAAYKGSTVRLYTYEIKKLEQFCPSVLFRDIDVDFIRRYHNWMKHKRKNMDSTIAKSFKFLRNMLNRAVEDKIYILENPMNEYDNVTYVEDIPEYLEWEDVQKLHAKIVGNPGLADGVKGAGYRFLLSCYSGLRFSDVMDAGYKPNVIQSGSVRRLVLSTTKTGEIVSIAFTEEIESVIDWINDNPLTISVQKYNDHIRFLAAVAEVPRLKSHMGRHTFGMRCAELGMAIDDVQRLMGHSKREQTQRYFRIKDVRLDKAMGAWKTPPTE